MNQQSWRDSYDKLTFIVCLPVEDAAANGEFALAGRDDTPDKMVGDVNMFIYPLDDDEGGSGRDEAGKAKPLSGCIGEIDIMIANSAHRNKGIGGGAVTALLRYVMDNSDAIARIFLKGEQPNHPGSIELKQFVAKIHVGNFNSIALFKSLGFEQVGDQNYFGEVKMVLDTSEFAEKAAKHVPEEYVEMDYRRNLD